MANATKPRPGQFSRFERKKLKIGAGINIIQGVGAVLQTAAGPNKGYVVPAGTAKGLTLGRFTESYDNTNGTGHPEKEVEVPDLIRCFHWNNDGTNPVGQADCGSEVFWADNQTVSSSDSSGTRGSAGVAIFIHTNGFVAVLPKV
jgi:hypothetical protein